MLITPQKLEELFVKTEIINKAEFDLTKNKAEKEKIPLDRLIVEKGLVNNEIMAKTIGDHFGYEYFVFKKANIEDLTPKFLNYIPEVVAHAQKAVVFEEKNGVLKVATSQPNNYNFFKLLEKKIGKRIKVFYSTAFDISRALKKYRGDLRFEMQKLLDGLEKESVAQEQNIVDLTNMFLNYAYTNLASDIHIAPLSEYVVVRFRIDGIMYKILEYPRELHPRIVSRIKIVSNLRTDEKSAPQDGRFNFEMYGVKIDVRVSIMPVTEGENVVMRILSQRGKRFTIEELGLLEDDLKKIKKNTQKPYGMIIVGGPTGSGKTTTLYGVLQLLNKPEVNIMTIEDPVEYNIEGVQQTQVNVPKEVTFPKGLRSIVRQDPDVIMVGEIRDEETANMAVNSAMTGHLVLSTMHANDSSTTFPRLLEMGVESFLIASSVNVTIAQRLARSVCQECKEEYYLSGEEIRKIEEESGLKKMIEEVFRTDNLSTVKFYKGKGCKFCENTGYVGRTAVFEILNVSDKIRELIVSKASSDEIRNQAIKEGMTTMTYDGIRKAMMGIITLDEVRRVSKL